METTPPFHVVSGQRQLAAIMFTDAVSFSAQMNAQEVATLNRMERDTEVMRRIAQAQGGVVLKSTGDGLLIRFGSAVQAVACALEIQHGFSSRGGGGPAGGELRHRIGIHLGDVFVQGDDVMGDGVNIAARLVGLAPPGGIVISQVVHEVVRNKLTLHAVPLGQRQLKNIKEPMLLFRLQLELPPAQPAAAAPLPAPVTPVPVPRRVPRPLLGLLAVLAVGAAGWLVVRTQRAYERELRESQATQDALAGMVGRETAGMAGTGEDPAAVDFAALTTSRPAEQRVPAEPAERRREAEHLQEPLRTWVGRSLAAHTRDRPLRVDGLGDPAFAGTTLFTEAGQLFFAEGGAFRRRNWAELGTPAQAAVIVALVRAAREPVPPEVRRGAEAFAYLHGHPQVIAALPRLRP